jgi:biopolymer transport protein ExbD
MKTNKTLISEHVNPNLIPMIDIMFLLLLFFMLGADMGQRELEDVRLPKASQVNADPQNTQNDRLTINAHHSNVVCDAYSHQKVCRDNGHWKLAIKGKDCTDPASLASTLKAETTASRHTDPQGRSIADRRVMIRSDAAAPYGLAQRAMNICAEQGIYKIEVGAAKPPAR